MIEGLIATVTAKDLRDILGKQAAHHEKRAVAYAKEATLAKKQHKRIKKERLERIEMTVRTGRRGRFDDDDDPATDFLLRQQQHASLAAEFRFLADHLEKGESYRLGFNDMKKLGVFE